ncbi:hypothetical protein BV898_15839 [Hypsibius exemplaris]|uniref:Uncharacterized protein n=1 Tax=Hypsibius exemplaris TaxID=2072580 RepID=A0A9X6NEQ6_HYPEX|nr:hypothetical protein BV898_15839 [Hypsibius exemplaris]
MKHDPFICTYDDQYWNLRTKDLGGVKWGTVSAFILGLVNQFLTWEYPILPVPGQQEVPSEEGDEENEDDDGELSRDGDSIEDDGGSESDGWESDDY